MTDEATKLKQIAELERSAATVLEIKRRRRGRRPIVIEFAGSPKAGKSSCISSLDIFLRRNKFKTKVLTERASVCPIENKFDPLFNVWTGCGSLNQLAEVLSKESRDLDIVIMDRGFFDSLIWFEWQRTHNFLRQDDYERFQSFFTAPRFRMMIDLVLLFECDPPISIDREYRNLLTRKEGSIMREKVLSGYRQAAGAAAIKYAKFFRAISHYNTGVKDQNQVSYEVTKQVLGKLKEMADERIGFVNRRVLDGIDNAVFPYDLIAGKISGNLSFDFRDRVERDKALVQFIPIAVVKDKYSDRYLSGRKAQKAVSALSPEKDRTLLYFGGHVREEDKTLFETPSDLDVFKQCLYREVKEEIGYDIDTDELNPKCIWVRDGKSDKHLAVVFLIERNIDHVKVTIDEEEFVKGEKRATFPTGAIVNVEEVIKLYPDLDSWSKNIVTDVVHIVLDKKLKRSGQGSLL